MEHDITLYNSYKPIQTHIYVRIFHNRGCFTKSNASASGRRKRRSATSGGRLPIYGNLGKSCAIYYPIHVKPSIILKDHHMGMIIGWNYVITMWIFCKFLVVWMTIPQYGYIAQWCEGYLNIQGGAPVR